MIAIGRKTTMKQIGTAKITVLALLVVGASRYEWCSMEDSARM